MKRNRFYSLAYVVLWPVIHVLFRPVVTGKERIPDGNAVFCCNHTSNWDPLVIMICAGYRHQLFAMAKAEIASWPVAGKILKLADMIFVERGKADIGAIRTAMKYLKNDRPILIFPEGTREKEGKILPPKSGLFVIAAEAGVDVVPCRILYDTPDGKMHLFCKVRVIYGEPMPAAQFAMEGRRDTKKLRANKQALLDAWEKMGR